MLKGIYGYKWDRRDYCKRLFLNGFKIGAEIGVYNGEFSNGIINALPALEKLYLIDPYKVYDDFIIKDDQETHNLRYKMVRSKFKNANVEIIRESSKNAISLIPDKSLDFIYIDANHAYEEVLWDIEHWSKKVKDNGLISGHDYDFTHWNVIIAVNEYCNKSTENIRIIVFENDSIWALLRETENEKI